MSDSQLAKAQTGENSPNSGFEALANRIYNETHNVPAIQPQTRPPWLQSPGEIAPAELSPKPPTSTWPGTGWSAPPWQVPVSPNLQPTREEIPTLRAGEPAQQDDSTNYSKSALEARIYDMNKSAIVRVHGHGRDLVSPNMEYTGTGFFVDNHGDVATAFHVIEKLESITVTTADGVDHPAKIVSTRPAEDLAVVSIGADQKTDPVKLARDSNDVQPGDILTGIGHPNGWPKEYMSPGKYTHTQTIKDLVGSVTIDGRNPQQQLMSANLNTQGGDSGGPVFNANGQVVGLMARGDGGKHGYLISVNDVWPMIKDLHTEQGAGPDLSDIPSKVHFGSSTPELGIQSAVLALTLRNSSNIWAARAGGLTSIIAGQIGAHELIKQDWPFLQTALESGSTREKVSASIDVGADALMIGGAVAAFAPSFRKAAMAISLTGTVLKLGNDLAAYRRFD